MEGKTDTRLWGRAGCTGRLIAALTLLRLLADGRIASMMEYDRDASTLRPGRKATYKGNVRRESKELRRAVLTLIGDMRPDSVLQRLAEEARRLVGARYAALGIMDDQGRMQKFYTTGITKEQRRAIGTLPEGHGLLGILFHDGKALRVPSIQDHAVSVGFPPNHPPMNSFLGVPIYNKGKNVGNIYLTDKIGAAEFTKDDQGIIEELALYASVAITNAGLYEQAVFRAHQWESLSRITNKIASSLDYKEVLNQVVREARSLLRVDVAFVSLLHPDDAVLRITAWSGLKTKEMRGLEYRGHQGLGGLALQSGDIVISQDYSQDERFVGSTMSESVRKEGLISHMAMALEARGQQLGVLYLATRWLRHFSSEEMDLVRQLAALSAVALDNAQLYAGERAAHLAAAEARVRLSLVLENMPEAVFMVSPDRTATLANRAASRIILGDESLRLEGRKHPFGLTFFRPDGRPVEYGDTPVAQCLSRGEPSLGVELVVQRQDGTRIPLLANVVALTDRDGNVSSVVAVQQDISRLKEVEQMKSDFLSMITHDLKSPLTTIKGLTSSMLMEGKSEAIEAPSEWIKMIDSESDRLTELVNNLLDMSRIEAGGMELYLEECYLIDLISSYVDNYRGVIGPGHHPVVLDVPVELPPAFADYSQIERVLANLLNNAAKYSEDGKEIFVKASLVPNLDKLLVEVTDSGIGIPPDEAVRVFDKFYRSPNTLGGRRKGSGLGLAICRAIVEAHGGRITVHSNPGQGSKFCFTLPVADGD